MSPRRWYPPRKSSYSVEKEPIMNGKKIAVVSGLGIDDACCSAAVLLRNGAAEVVASTPRCIDRTMTELAAREEPPREIHVCGMQVECDWGALTSAALDLREKDSAVFWHCGLGCLEKDRERLESISIPAFVDCRSNTEAVCVTLRLSEERRMTDLLRIAEAGLGVREEEDPAGAEDTEFWMDYIRASGWEFFRGGDRDRYADAIRTVLAQKRDTESRSAVDNYRHCIGKYARMGGSAGIEDLRSVTARCGEVTDVVLIEGESGIEREEAARLIHEEGARALDPFVLVSCGRVGGDARLAGSTLFGQVKGAHGDAAVGRPGAFVAAGQGTLFLDEIGVVPLEVQGRLLRALECGTVVPEGAGGPRMVHARIIAGTSLDLADMVREGYFLEDLYHRIGALRIVMPPLRQRSGDIPVIAEKVLADAAGESRIGTPGADETAALAGWDWPGGVPQLVKVIRRAAYLGMSLGEALDEERRAWEEGAGGPPEEEGMLPGSADEVRPLKEIQREYALRAWKVNNGNTTAAARALGVSRNTLASYIAEAG
jgi:DNA-binding NtrC family response regulator